MKRILAGYLIGALCLCLAACGNRSEPVHALQETAVETGSIPSEPAQEEPRQIEETEQTEETEQAEENGQECPELVGPWHLDSEKNDLAAFADSLDLFPGYGEWGAGMEIRSDGLMSWYIGAEGWHGDYTLEEGILYARLTSDLDQSVRTWNFRVVTERETAELEMDYNGMTIIWVYGDREEETYE